MVGGRQCLLFALLALASTACAVPFPSAAGPKELVIGYVGEGRDGALRRVAPLGDIRTIAELRGFAAGWSDVRVLTPKRKTPPPATIAFRPPFAIAATTSDANTHVFGVSIIDYPTLEIAFLHRIVLGLDLEALLEPAVENFLRGAAPTPPSVGEPR